MSPVEGGLPLSPALSPRFAVGRGSVSPGAVSRCAQPARSEPGKVRVNLNSSAKTSQMDERPPSPFSPRDGTPARPLGPVRSRG